MIGEIDSVAVQPPQPRVAGDAEVADINSAKQRRYPPSVERKLAATREGAGDVLPLRADTAAEKVLETAQPAELAQQLDEQQPQPSLRASGDNDVRASAGTRRPAQRGTGSSQVSPARGPSRAAGTSGTSQSPIPIRRVTPPEHLVEPKLVAGDVNICRPRKRWISSERTGPRIPSAFRI